MTAIPRVIKLDDHRDKRGFPRPKCQNPNCENHARMGKNGLWLKYCADPQCAKSAWYHKTISASVRRNSQVPSEISPENRIEDALIRMAEAIESIPTRLIQQPLPLPDKPIQRQSESFIEEDERLNMTVNQAKVLDNPVFNMLISVASIDVTGFIGLELEVLKYGIEQGKIPPHYLDLKLDQIRQRHGDTQPTIAIEIPANGAKPIAGADAELTAPDLEDLDLVDW